MLWGRILNIIKLERLGCYGEHKVPVLAICRSNGKPMRTLLVKRKVCLCKPRASLPWECERYLISFLLGKKSTLGRQFWRDPGRSRRQHGLSGKFCGSSKRWTRSSPSKNSLSFRFHSHRHHVSSEERQYISFLLPNKKLPQILVA